MKDQTSEIRIPPRGTRGSGIPGGRVLAKLFRPFMSRQVERYKKVTTKEPAKFMGMPLLLLTTVGAKTGNEHTSILGGFPDGDDAWLVIASNGGAASHPHWFVNVAKNPGRVWAQVGSRRMRVNVDCLPGEQRAEAYQRVVAVSRNYGGYLTKTDREIPVLRLTPAGD